MGVSRKGNPRYYEGVDKNGKKAYRVAEGTNEAKKSLAAKVVAPVKALADDASLLSHYANDLMIRVSLRIDDILHSVKLEVEDGKGMLREVAWGAPIDDVTADKETEKKVLAALEKFASRTSP